MLITLLPLPLLPLLLLLLLMLLLLLLLLLEALLLLLLLLLPVSRKELVEKDDREVCPEGKVPGNMSVSN